MLHTRLTLLVKSNQIQGGSGSDTYGKPLTAKVMICIGVSLVLTSLTLALFNWILRNNDEKDVGFSFPLCFVIAVGGLCAQGTPHEPKRVGSRIVFVILFLFGVVIVASYSASLTSFLAVQKIKMPFTDLESMYYETDYKIAFIRSSAAESFWKVQS